MSRVLSLSVGPRPAFRAGSRTTAWRALFVSGGTHALVIGSVVAWTLLGWHRLGEPEDPPKVDVVLDGGGAEVSGVRAAAPSPPAEATPQAPLPQPVPPPQTPAMAATPPPAFPPASPLQTLAPAPSPPPPPSQTAGLTPLPPAEPMPAMQPPPQPQPPPIAPAPAPTPPPVQVASLGPPPSPESAPAPEIRLGDGAAGPLAELLDDSGVIRRAKADNGNVPPAYPLDAARRGEHGLVTLRLTIGTDGGVLDAEVAKSSGSPRLDRAAREQISTWHFKPALRAGKPQIDVIDLGVEFVLE